MNNDHETPTRLKRCRRFSNPYALVPAVECLLNPDGSIPDTQRPEDIILVRDFLAIMERLWPGCTKKYPAR